MSDDDLEELISSEEAIAAGTQYAYLQAHIRKLEADNGKLRKALEAVEWDEITNEFGIGGDYKQCLWCYKIDKHAPNCPRQLALGLTEVEK